MSRLAKSSVEFRHYFEILRDLAAAERDQIPSIIEFHRNELRAIAMHTDSALLRRACEKKLAESRATVPATISA